MWNVVFSVLTVSEEKLTYCLFRDSAVIQEIYGEKIFSEGFSTDYG